MAYQKMLVAINVYEDFYHELATAEKIAQKNDASLTLLMVLNTPYELIPMAVEHQSKMIEQMQRDLERQSKDLNLKSVTYNVQSGTPHHCIVDYAKEGQYDLIIIGSHGKHGVNRILGSTANGVLHRAPCDVLTVRLGQEQTPKASVYQNLLVSTDFEPDSEEVEQRAKLIAEQYNATLHAINVQADPTVAVSAYGVVPNMHNEMLDNANEKLKKWCEKHQISGEAKCVMGETAFEITRFADENSMDLIVVGSHDRNAIARFFLGSTANAILHQANQDVLVARLK